MVGNSKTQSGEAPIDIRLLREGGEYIVRFAFSESPDVVLPVTAIYVRRARDLHPMCSLVAVGGREYDLGGRWRYGRKPEGISPNSYTLGACSPLRTGVYSVELIGAGSGVATFKIAQDGSVSELAEPPEPKRGTPGDRGRKTR